MGGDKRNKQRKLKMNHARNKFCTDYNKLIGAKLREARKDAKVEPKVAAHILHRDSNHLGRIEKGLAHIRACDLFMLATLYKKNIDFFFEFDSNKNSL